MMNQIPLVRYERKFVPEGFTPEGLLAMVRHHPALFREVYPERCVNNLYFDTHNLRHYQDHVNGAANRAKIRVRWYGDFHGENEHPALEFKIRHGAVGRKVTYSLPALDLDGNFDRKQFEEALRGLPSVVCYQMREHMPWVANRYRRRYFCSGDGKVRLTIDRQIECLDARLDGVPLRPIPAVNPETVVELKYDPADTDSAVAIALKFPFRLTRFSKYIRGIESL
jgi:hypothetical protein